MTAENSHSDELLRQMFKVGNRFMVLLFRLGLGGWGNRPETSQVMVLVHKGRKSGLMRRTPVNYAIVDDQIYCTAAFGSRADWYRNVVADPRVQVWLPDGWYAGEAEEVPPDDPQRNAPDAPGADRQRLRRAALRRRQPQDDERREAGRDQRVLPADAHLSQRGMHRPRRAGRPGLGMAGDDVCSAWPPAAWEAGRKRG